jgi:hypothetical protein
MDERELVKKAIADKAVPLVERASDEDLKRYTLTTRSYRVPIDLQLDGGIIGTNLAPEKWSGIDWGSTPGFTTVQEMSIDEARSLYPEHSRTVSAVEAMREYSQYLMAYNSSFFMGIDRSGPYARPSAVLEPPPEIPRPSKDILKRFTVTDRNVTDMRAELASEAESLLGYSVLRKRLGMQSPLTQVLLKLEIEPFDGKTVAEYKKQMLAYAQNEAARMDVTEGIRPRSWQARVARWETSDIENYTKPIPEFAIEKALQIKKAFPEVQFEIEELTVVPDPFLIAVLGNVRRYIEVWDEPKFGTNLPDSCGFGPHNVWVLLGLFALFLLLSACAYATRTKTGRASGINTYAALTKITFVRKVIWLPKVYVPARDVAASDYGIFSGGDKRSSGSEESSDLNRSLPPWTLMVAAFAAFVCAFVGWARLREGSVSIWSIMFLVIGLCLWAYSVYWFLTWWIGF